MAATMGLRIATSATNLVSQPRAALASVAPEGIAGKAVADLAGDNTLAAGKSLSFATAAGQLAIAAKEAGVAPSLLHDPAAPATTDGTAQSSPAPAPAAQTAPPLAALTPPPVAVATDATQALPMMPHAVAAQVAASLGQAVRVGNDHIQIQLQPADLGAVAVKLSINHDGRVTMVVSADRSDTLNLLQQNQASLTEALRNAGLSADSSSLSFNLRGGFQFQQQAAGGNAGSGAQSLAGVDAPVAAEAVAATRLSFHSGSLDIHV
jgi:flagellar hook-length control protein FliK